MPTAVSYVEPNEKGRLDDFGEGNNERNNRADKYNRALKYYLGDQRKQLNKREGQPDDNTIVNLVQMTADRTVSFLFPASPVFELKPHESETTALEKWLTDCYEYNGGLALFQKMGLIGYLSGQVYVRVRPPQDGEPYPRIILLDPRKTITYWHEDDYREPLWHETRWKRGDTEYLLDVVNEGSKWRLLQYKRERTTRWQKDVESVWDYPEGPIVSWQHQPNPNSFYGLEEARDFELQDTVNLLISEMARIIRYHASPRTVAIGVQAEDVQETAVDMMWAIDNDQARVQNLEMQSDLLASRELVTYLQDMYVGMRRVVILKGDVEAFQRVTNTGIRTLFLDMLAKRAVLTRQYGYGLRALSLLLGVTGNKGELYPTIHHIDPLPTDQKERAELEISLMESKLQSHETAAINLDRNWNDEVAKMAVEQDLSFLYPPVELSDNLDSE